MKEITETIRNAKLKNLHELSSGKFESMYYFNESELLELLSLVAEKAWEDQADEYLKIMRTEEVEYVSFEEYWKQFTDNLKL